MEKNALIAVVLSMVVLLLWSFFGSQSEKTVPQPPAVEQAAEQEVAKPVPTNESVTASTPFEPSVAVPEVVPTTQARTIVVEHPLYRAELTENQAGILSFRLKKYRETVAKDSPPLELFKAHQPCLVLGLYNNSVPELPRALFTSDRSRIDLTGKSAPETLTFQWTSPQGLRFIKKYTFHPDSYLIDLDITVSNFGAGVFDDNLELSLIGSPFDHAKSSYNEVHMTALIGNSLETEALKKLEEQDIVAGEIHWAAYVDNYFMTAMVPDQAFTGSVRISPRGDSTVRIDLVNPPANLPKAMETRYGYHLYFGPRQLEVLKSLHLGLERIVDYGFFDIIAKPVLYLLKWFYKGLHNYGLAIILVTVIIKILFWPLTQKSYTSMKAMKDLQPQMTKIREQYKDDKQRINAEMMGLYKTHKVNPLGGCLPMVIQIPVFFALYRILVQSIEMRHAPFMLWVNDLSAPDRLPIGFDLPYVGGLPVLTLLMGLSMFIQQKMTPTPGDPTQAKMMMMLPIVFTFLFINFPSGLVLYWLVNNILSIGQQYLINKKA